ncbi:MAG: hypothetical protein LBR83_09935 [Clostridiales bacterium]|jgi:hypothetical protein|nr:hypothetical protein [Clostridiales bacterium]
MKNQKSILLPSAFFTKTLLLLWRLDAFYELDGDTFDLCVELTKMVECKFEAMNRRSTFSKYKMSVPGSPEREALRNAYLDISYCSKDWRSKKETHFDPSFHDDVPF